MSNEHSGDSAVNLYLVGFMGTGKTTVGRLVAHRLGMKLIDSDVAIEERAGKPISRIFDDEGEQTNPNRRNHPLEPAVSRRRPTFGRRPNPSEGCHNGECRGTRPTS